MQSSDKQNGGTPSTPASTRPAPDMKGTWSGTFISRRADASPFTITVHISPDSQGRLLGDSSLNSNCLRDARLLVMVSGSNVVLAGSDNEGDTISFRGNIDKTGTVLTLNYIINGSASPRCETDDGTGTMGKR